MFTGIVEELGTVKNIQHRTNFFIIDIVAEKLSSGVKVAESIAVNGVCLTLIDKKQKSLLFEVIPHTFKQTNLGLLRVSDRVNLERALRLGDTLSGHFVSGHIDCLGIIRKRGYRESNVFFEIAVPLEFKKYCIPRGSITVDGISLTIADVKSNVFLVNIIPYTLKNTNLNFRMSSDKVNIEFDILLKRDNSL